MANGSGSGSTRGKNNCMIGDFANRDVGLTISQCYVVVVVVVAGDGKEFD